MPQISANELKGFDIAREWALRLGKKYFSEVMLSGESKHPYLARVVCPVQQ